MRSPGTRRAAHILLAAAAILLAACAARGAGRQPSGKVRVVASFSVVGEIINNVGGDRIELTTLVGPGLDTHTFNPSPKDAAALAEAELIVQNGFGFEYWLDDLYTASGSTAPRVVLTEGLRPIMAGSETDPHVWHSAANVERMVSNAAAALAQVDPASASVYQTNSAAYLAQLRALDDWIIEQVKTVPPERRILVTTHDTFAYFAQRYDFQILGSILPTSTEGASPSAEELAALVTAVRAAGVPAVFAENVSSSSLLNQVAAEARVHVIDSLYTDALGPPGSDGDTYLGMMRHNVRAIVLALGG